MEQKEEGEIMQFTINQEALVRVLKDLAGAVNSKAIQPVLANMLVETVDASTVRFTATDLDVTISVIVAGVMVMQTGAITLPHKLLSEAVPKLPAEMVQIAVKDDVAEITCRKSKFTLNTLPANDYPTIKRIEPNGSAVSAEVLRLVITQTAFATASYDQSSILGGVYLTAENGQLNAVGTDGSRMAHRVEKGDGKFSAIIPSRAVVELAKVFGKEPVSIATDGGAVVAKSDTTYLSARLIGGEYPRYQELFPSDYKHSALFDREALLAALTRVAVMADDRTNLVRIDFANDEAILKAQTPDVGNASESVQCVYEGAPFTVSCNFRYILDVLKVLSDPEIRVETQGELKPLIFKSTNDDNFKYLLMPVQTR